MTGARQIVQSPAFGIALLLTGVVLLALALVIALL